MKKIIFIFLISILLLPLAMAFEIITEPPNLKFENVLVGSTVEKKITVSTDSHDFIDVSIDTTSLLNEWVSVEPDFQKINSQTPGEFILTINPENAQVGTYQGIIVVNSIYTGDKITGAVSSSVKMNVELGLTEKEIIQAQVEDISVEETEQNQPLQLTLYFLNTGNKEIIPNFEVSIYDVNQNPIASQTKDALILPSPDAKKIDFTFDQNLPVGDYVVKSRILYNDFLIGQQTIPFSIAKPGTLTPKPQIPAEKTPLPLSAGPVFIMLLAVLAVFTYAAIKRKSNRDKKIKKKKNHSK